MAVRVRFAPSPPGHFHIGSARPALFNYLYAKRHNGVFILRIEDTDTARNREGAEEGFYHAMRWLGLEWGEGVVVEGPHAPYSSLERLDTYRTHMEQLIHNGQAYRCYCTKEELDAANTALIEQGKTPGYGGQCRNLTEAERVTFEQEGRESTVRFRVGDDQIIAFDDLIRGHIEFDSRDIGDFVIVKSDGIPLYNFACAVDDGLMKVSHIIRGEEHLSNTPKQILLANALGFGVPEFAHVSLILNEDGKKLSKRDESIVQFIGQYEDMGYLPEAIINFLALLGWSPGGEQELFTMEELCELFSFERVNRSGAVFDRAKLDWMNGVYIKQAELSRIVEMAIVQLKKAGLLNSVPLTPETMRWLTGVVELYREQLQYVGQLPDVARLFFAPEAEYEQEATAVMTAAESHGVLRAAANELEQLQDWAPEEIKAAFKRIGQESGQKGRGLFMPIRCAATGSTHGPDLPRTLYLLGQECVVARLRAIG